MHAWQIAVLVRFFTFALVVYFIRRAMVRETRSLSIFLQFVFAGAWTSVVAIFEGQFDFSKAMMLAAALGGFSAVGVYFMWHANAISTSKNGFFTAIDDIIAMFIVAFIIPGSLAGIHLLSLVGMSMCIIAAFALAWNNWLKKRQSDPGVIPGRFWVYACSYAAIWGITNAAVGIAAFWSIGLWRALSGWYLGAMLVGAGIYALDKLGFFPRGKEHSPLGTVTLESIYLGAGISLALMLQYLAYQDRSPIILQPIFLVLDLAAALFVGFRYFGEWKKFDRNDIAIFTNMVVGFMLAFWS